MFKKIVVFFIIVSFLFCFKSISSQGIDAPITLKDKIIVFNYDKTNDTLYLIPTNKTNHCFYIYNLSANTYTYTIYSNLKCPLSFLGKEVDKNLNIPLYPYSYSYTRFNLSKVDVEKGYLIIKIKNLGGEVIKTINIKKVTFLPEHKQPANYNIKDFEILEEENNIIITNIKTSSILIYVNLVIKNQKHFYIKKIQPFEKYEICTMSENIEYVLSITSHNQGFLKENFLSLKKNINKTEQQAEQSDTQIYFAKNQQEKIVGFLPYENVLFLICHSIKNQKIEIKAKMSNSVFAEQEYYIKKGWNKIIIPNTENESLVEGKLEILFFNESYEVEKIFIRPESQNKETKFFFFKDSKIIKYNTDVSNNYKFFIIEKNQGLLYGEYLSKDKYNNIPTYFNQKSIMTHTSLIEDIIIIECNATMDLISPIPDDQ